VSTFATIVENNTVRLERVFPISVEQLWVYLTTPEGLRRWIAEGEIGPERAQLKFLDNGSFTEGAVTAWEPPNLVEFNWTGGPTQPEGSRVRFELNAEGIDSRLVLTHTRVVADAAASFAAGWHRHLDTLEFLADGVEPSPERPTWADLNLHYLGLVTDRTRG
jgi:uncharacterized protein YndB with AHSA1/START domain